MADNVAITPGLGASIATDDVGGVQYQRVKLAYGADGAAADAQLSTPFPTRWGLITAEQCSRATISCASSGDNTIIAPSGVLVPRIYGILFIVDTQVAVKLKDSTPTDLTGAMKFGGGGGLLLTFQGEPYFTIAAGRGLIINLGAAVQCSGVVWYTAT